MFQNVNATNSALFALLSKYQQSVYPPKVLKMAPPFLQITRNSPTIFRFEQREMEPSKFTANYVKIAQFATPSHESREFCAILVKFYKSLLPNCTPTFYSKIPRNSLTSQRFRAIDAKLPISHQFQQISYFIFQTLVRQDSAPCLCELREFRNLKLKFANSS